jgi:hypothetical protein
MHDFAHIPFERLREVADNPETVLTEFEQQHLDACLECLSAFERILCLDSDRIDG